MVSEYKWLIVQGCPRSGTTILAKILNTNENLGITYENDLRKIKQKELVDKYKSLFNNKEKIIYFGDKLPDYAYHTKELEKRFNDLKIIHISRNSLFTINSIMKRTKNAKKGLDKTWNPFLSLRDACIYWILAWNEINKQKNNPNILHVKYEDLIENPTKETEKIANFLQIKNKFDFSFLYSEQKPINLTTSELKIINTYLSKIIKSWNLPLKEIENKFPRIKNIHLPKIRKKIKIEIWNIHKKLKNIK